MIEWCPPATLGGSNPAVNLSDSPRSLMPEPLSVHAFRFVRGSRPPIGSRVDRRCRPCRPRDGTDTGAGWCIGHPAPLVAP